MLVLLLLLLLLRLLLLLLLYRLLLGGGGRTHRRKVSTVEVKPYRTKKPRKAHTSLHACNNRAVVTTHVGLPLWQFSMSTGLPVALKSTA